MVVERGGRHIGSWKPLDMLFLRDVRLNAKRITTGPRPGRAHGPLGRETRAGRVRIDLGGPGMLSVRIQTVARTS